MRKILTQLLVLTPLILTPGCAAWFQGQGAPHAKVELHAQGIRRVAVVEFADLTRTRIPRDLSRVFGQTLKEQLGNLILETPLPRPGPRLAGSWLKAEAQAKGVEGFVTGTVTGYQAQPDQGRVCVTMTVRLLEASSGSILWSKHHIAFVPLEKAGAPEEAFRQAVVNAAKEFAHDFLPPSS
jgi:hypothetical protein